MPGPETDRLLQIGEAADLAKLSLRTVRYYEEMGLVTPETRTEGGFRLYTMYHVERLQLIRRMKPLGFSVQGMRELLDARDAVAAAQADVEARERLARFAEDVKRRVDDLAAKAARGSQLLAVLERESRGEVVDGRPPEFGDS